jgi:hypothetical protein
MSVIHEIDVTEQAREILERGDKIRLTLSSDDQHYPIECDGLPLEYKLKYGTAKRALGISDIILDPVIRSLLGIVSPPEERKQDTPLIENGWITDDFR